MKFVPAPNNCDLCHTEFSMEPGTLMYDAAFRGPWGCFCDSCFKKHGMQIGTGKGQKYERREDGSFERVAG
jgi:hypothetical protein